LVAGDRSGFPINHQSKTINPPNFSVKEKDEASLANCFRQDPLDAFILRFAGVWRFFHFPSPPCSALVSQP